MTALAETVSPIASPTTARAVARVAAARPNASALGNGLMEHIADPEAFASALRAGLTRLADPEFLEGQQREAPGIGPILGVRAPLLAAVAAAFHRASRHERAATLLFVADRLIREPCLEERWFAFGLLERTLRADAERTWQLLRRAARDAADWITVDTLAHPYASGIAAEPYRWAELEQLAYSPSRWERRLIGSTIATMTHGPRRKEPRPDVAEHGLELLGQLMGDDEPDVQRALAWAYRSLAEMEPAATTAALERETGLAIAGSDGHRAWVIRDSLTKLDSGVAADLHHRLAGVRKRPGAPSTSYAASTAQAPRPARAANAARPLCRASRNAVAPAMANAIAKARTSPRGREVASVLAMEADENGDRPLPMRGFGPHFKRFHHRGAAEGVINSVPGQRSKVRKPVGGLAWHGRLARGVGNMGGTPMPLQAQN